MKQETGRNDSVQPLIYHKRLIHKKKISELVDFNSLQTLLDYFYEVVGIADAIIDLDGIVLLGSGWQDTCTKYHRVHPVTCAKCIGSDTSLTTRMLKGEEYALYRCPNGLVDAATPIKIEGDHVANFFLGQFFLAPPDLAFFRKQAAEFGFNEKSYLEAVSKVPIVSEKKVRFIMKFLVSLTEVLGKMGLQQIKLNEALRTLEAHDKLKDEFLANTSHELRTPLNGIIGLAESLIDGVTGELPDKTKANLAMIMGSGKRLFALVNDILDFSKLKQKELELQLKSVGLREIVDIVLTLSQHLKGQKDLQLINAIDFNLPLAYADENRLQQIFYNLVGNAVKFTKSGTVEVTAKVISQNIEICVADTGIGIPADKLERIFESFEQAEGSTAREYGGTGLGLTVTRQLVQLHGGNIWVESTPAIGSQFKFTLPIAEGREIKRPSQSLVSNKTLLETVVSAETVVSTSQIREGQFKILAVDDEPVNLQVLVNHLSLHDYTVIQASSGFEALRLLEDGLKPDLILLDVMMPKMTGYEVMRKIRETYELNELPTILLTAKNQISDLVTGLEVGANDYLMKPVSKNELLARVKIHLKLHHLNTAYSRFVPHAFLKFLNKESIVDIQLGDHIEKEMTILFSDIRNFTSLSEKMTPKENFDFINAYLSRMAPIIAQHQGFIDKYIGDAIMALFPTSADEAVSTSIAMLKKLAAYNKKRQKSGLEPIAIGIGLNTGLLMLGTIGDENRMDGTVISDAVNLASRIEGLTKMYGAALLISEETYAHLNDVSQYAIRTIDRVTVKGKSEPVTVYEVFDGDAPSLLELKMQTRDDFESGLIHYREKEFVEAITCFEQVLQININDQAAKIYINRCKHWKKVGIPSNWMGVEILDSK
jgi:two-component system sensor histidine kinase ChiS